MFDALDSGATEADVVAGLAAVEGLTFAPASCDDASDNALA